ncbi:MAG: PucR family transcriptional regulator [Gordonia sp. (in: high G+C Gram-positive bacteria)]
MILADLLDETRFGLELLEDPHGDARNIPITRIFSTDQPRPRRYMSGGELVLTGLIFHRGDSADSTDFVDSAVDGGAVAIGAGLDRFGHIPDHLRAACRAGGVPLFSVPADVSFADITQAFIDRAAEATQRVRRSLARSRELLTAVGTGRALDEIAAMVVAASRVHCWVLTAGGKLVAAVGPALPDTTVDDLLATAADASSLPTVVGAHTVFGVGNRRERSAAWYLVIDARVTDVSPEVIEAFGELAALAALIRARNADAAFVQDAHDDAAIGRLVAGQETMAGAILVVRSQPVTSLRPIVRDALVTAADPVVGIHDGDIVVLLPGTPRVDAVVADLRRHLGRVAPLLREPIQVGVSGVVGAIGIGGALRSARFAANVGGGGVTVTHAESLGSALTLLTRLPDDVRAEFVDRVLGAVRRYDDRTDAGLVPMLREFLAQGGSWVRTADAMHVHPNTVRYRIAKVEELTGRDLGNMADRVDIHLALALS